MESDVSKQADRVQKISEWLKHLHDWKATGKSLVAYAKDQGLTPWAMYHWRGVLIREGHWREELKTKSSAKSQGDVPPARFAQVAVTERAAAAALTVRLHLANGRHAEIELMEVEQLVSMLIALEHQP
jgi:hypothetical protein